MKNLIFLQRTEEEDTDTDTVKVLLDTKELVWSNRLRAKALTSGIQLCSKGAVLAQA